MLSNDISVKNQNIEQECLLNNLFYYLLPDTTAITKISECDDLFSLMVTNRSIRNMILPMLIKRFTFTSSSIRGWEKGKKNLVHRLIVENEITEFPQYLDAVTFGNTFNHPLYHPIIINSFRIWVEF